MTSTNLSIVIPFRGNEYRASILMNLLRQLTENEVKINYEIIVIDSSGHVNYNHPYVRIINRDINIGAARNMGVKESGSNIILFIDADCFVSRDFINRVCELAKDLNNDNYIGAIGGPVECIPTSSIIQKYLDYSLFSPFPRCKKEYICDWETLHKEHHPNMCNLLIKKNIFEMLGGCWEDYGEDLHLLLRLAKNGYKIKYSPQLKINHIHPKKIKDLICMYYRNGKSAAKIVLTFPSSPLIFHRLIKTISIFIPPLLFLLFFSVTGSYFSLWNTLHVLPIFY
jgi:GT2 family glycosyltransferase